MKIFTETIRCKDELLVLTNHRVVYWESKDMLILSDLHIGKAAHFRKSGIPISLKVLESDLERLDALINIFKVSELMVVGDLFHAEMNEDVAVFQKWMKKHINIKIILVKGNHDRNNFELYEPLNIQVKNREFIVSPITFTHHANILNDTSFYISGHTHPGVSIRGRGRQRLKLPCYQVTPKQLILPAFSLFTGLNTLNSPEMCVNYAFTDSSIFKV